MKKRISQLQGMMENLDCLIVTSPLDIFYYTGYMPMKEDGSVLVVLREGARLFTAQNGHQIKKARVKITSMKKALA